MPRPEFEHPKDPGDIYSIRIEDGLYYPRAFDPEDLRLIGLGFIQTPSQEVGLLKNPLGQDSQSVIIAPEIFKSLDAYPDFHEPFSMLFLHAAHKAARMQVTTVQSTQSPSNDVSVGKIGKVFDDLLRFIK